MSKPQQKKPSTPGLEDTLPATPPSPVQKPVQKVEAAPTAPVEISGLPRVGIEVFVVVSGHKPDQLAGFVSWAKRKKMTPRTIPEWKAELTTFGNRPV